MLVSFSIKNFYSIKDKITISFEANKTKERDNRFRVIDNKTLSTAMVFLGGNGSGKTKILIGLGYLLFIMFNSFRGLDSEEKLRFESHFFLHNEPTEFEISFYIDKLLYSYQLILTTERILYEELRLKDDHKSLALFMREWCNNNQEYNYKDTDFGFKAKEAKNTRPNASIISAAVQYNVKKAKYLKENFKILGDTSFFAFLYGNFHYFKFDIDIDEAIEFFYKNPKFLEKFNKIIPNLDLGLTRIDIKEIKSESLSEKFWRREIEYDPICIHRCGEQEAKLTLYQQSSGTKRLFCLYAGLLPILEDNSKGPKLAIIDELDTELHPDLLQVIVSLFLNPETNPHSAQLIFTSHNQDILLELDKYQIALVEKDESLSTDAWRISDIEGVRPDDNIYKKYKAGAYGGKPKL